MSLNIDLHILQTVPPSNLNRDDSGSPKSAQYGGVRRARVSSQAWKRATRADFSRRLSPNQVGVRTLRAAELLAERVVTLDPSVDPAAAAKLAEQALGAVGLKLESRRKKKDAPDEEDPGVKTEYLVFFSNEQLDRLAELALTGEKTARAYKAIMQGNNGVDLALFGRMVANDADLNVDASVQVAHALSTHAVDNEFDFYTAVDDKAPKEETGAGMMGTIEFNSSVLYRYATLNVDLLAAQLGEPSDAVRAVAEFVRSFIESMPTGKQNTFANGTLPDAVVVSARSDRGVSYVGAFERPVRAGRDGGYLQNSAAALTDYAKDVVAQYASPAGETWVLRVGSATDSLDALGGTRVTLPQLTDAVCGAVSEHLGLA
ncbi:MAG: type I-E CRISPR-associated protein Cas7/Cse4/CasC [Micropruina sp.]|nr:type I-E CRISPR-associated protein Cas7/Cse4/CasC [Micropruina sp.]